MIARQLFKSLVVPLVGREEMFLSGFLVFFSFFHFFQRFSYYFSLSSKKGGGAYSVCALRS